MTSWSDLCCFVFLVSCLVIISIWYKEVIAIQTKSHERIHSISINYCWQQLEQEEEEEEVKKTNAHTVFSFHCSWCIKRIYVKRCIDFKLNSFDGVLNAMHMASGFFVLIFFRIEIRCCCNNWVNPFIYFTSSHSKETTFLLLAISCLRMLEIDKKRCQTR